jgi:hypothetical protein
MGVKLLWTGLTVSIALLGYLPQAALVGAIIMIIGCILMWMDK